MLAPFGRIDALTQVILSTPLQITKSIKTGRRSTSWLLRKIWSVLCSSFARTGQSPESLPTLQLHAISCSCVCRTRSFTSRKSATPWTKKRTGWEIPPLQMSSVHFSVRQCQCYLIQRLRTPDCNMDQESTGGCCTTMPLGSVVFLPHFLCFCGPKPLPDGNFGQSQMVTSDRAAFAQEDSIKLRNSSWWPFLIF